MLDLLIKNANTLDQGRIDIAISKGCIVEISKEITQAAKKTLILEDDELISSGWIDIHVHCFPEMTLYYDHPDAVGIETGVTTIVDAGSCGADNIDALYQWAQTSQTHVYALLNVSETGITIQNELSDLSKINTEKIKEKLKRYPNFIKGLKARMSQSVVLDQGIKPLERAKAIKKELKVPLMVHIGSAPPQLESILALLDKNDIVTHSLNGKANHILSRQNTVKKAVYKAQEKGVIFDLGHGSESFSFETGIQAFKDGFRLDTISTDIYHRNRVQGPVFDMATTLDKMRLLGYTINEVIDMITIRAAAVLNLENKGKIALGYDADFTVFKIIDNEPKILYDSLMQTKISPSQIQVVYAIVNGNIRKVNNNE